MPQRLVVVLCGPSGAGKTTAARGSGLELFDRDEAKWQSNTHFQQALVALGKQRDARAVVIRAAPTSQARAELAALVGATHTYLITAPRDELVQRIHHRGRADAGNTIAGLNSWFGRHDRRDGVLPFPGWPAILGDQLDLGITS